MMVCIKKLLAVSFDPKQAFFYLLEPLEGPYPDKILKVNIKTEALPQCLLVKQLSRFNSWDFKLYIKRIQFGRHIFS